MPYLPLAPVTALAAPDVTGKNPGNLTCAFDSSNPGMPKINVWEIFKMTVTGGPPLAFASIISQGQVFSTVTLDGFGSNEWDPQQPQQVIGNQAVYFLWTIAAPGVTGQIPSVTLWPRWDTSNPANKGL